jgi:hypothetical protein
MGVCRTFNGPIRSDSPICADCVRAADEGLIMFPPRSEQNCLLRLHKSLSRFVNSTLSGCSPGVVCIWTLQIAEVQQSLKNLSEFRSRRGGKTKRLERAFQPFVPMTFVGFGSIKRCTEPSIHRTAGANYRPIDGSLSFFLIVSHDNNH